MTTDLCAERFDYNFTPRVTEIRENEGSYLGGIEVGAVLDGSFGITNESLPRAGGYRTVFLQIETFEPIIRVDSALLLYLWWREGHFELGWDDDGRIAVFAPEYSGTPLPDSTTTTDRTRIRIKVTDSTRKNLTALQGYFPEATETAEGYLDPDEDGRDSFTEISMGTDPRVADHAPKLKLFHRKHPQDTEPVWVLELPFDGTVEFARFTLLQASSGDGGLGNWQVIEENDWNLSSQRHRQIGGRDPLLYGDPYGRGVIGLRLTPGEASSAFWKAKYFVH